MAADGSGVTRLKDLRQEGSMRAVFPNSAAQNVEAVFLNTAGGVTGGDHFSIDAQVGAQGRLSLTTQAAERIYRAVGTDFATVQNTLSVEQNAQLFWLPQETILFDGCRLKRRLDVEIAQSARFLMLEPLVFGREASGEDLKSCAFSDRVTLTCEGHPIYADGIQLNGNITETLRHVAIGNTARALANIVLVDPNPGPLLDHLRQLLPPTSGASLVAQNVLVVRQLAADSFALRQALLPILTLLTNDAVPKNWRL
ncbi:urease accessory protein UreD [Pseudosulfitobacter sp. SM2401]|uniref:urease accessory protein UreD n=1 Tax=Pseudosulfitobacter sp. SM2401 TaxID=3350098 RepID=UPI0036F391FA